VPLHFFRSKSTISRIGERFRDGQYSFLFAVLLIAVPPCPDICKSDGARATCLMESAPLPVMSGLWRLEHGMSVRSTINSQYNFIIMADMSLRWKRTKPRQVWAVAGSFHITCGAAIEQCSLLLLRDGGSKGGSQLTGRWVEPSICAGQCRHVVVECGLLDGIFACRALAYSDWSPLLSHPLLPDVVHEIDVVSFYSEGRGVSARLYFVSLFTCFRTWSSRRPS